MMVFSIILIQFHVPTNNILFYAMLATSEFPSCPDYESLNLRRGGHVKSVSNQRNPLTTL